MYTVDYLKTLQTAMRVRELHMREYYEEDIDDYNTAFSFVVDYEGMRYTVVEQTRKVSLEQLGLDLTLQDTGDFQQGFTIENRRVGQKERLCFVWWDFFECEKHADYRVLQNDIVKHFWPDIQFICSASASLFTGGIRKNWRLK